MKWLALLCVAGIGTAAHASFELLLVADNGSGNLATRKIHRYDAISGVYLGSFGGFNSTIVSTYLNQATNSLFVLSINGTTEWDYNTGLLKNSFAFTSTSSNGYAVRPSGDRLAFFDNTTDFLIYNFPGASLVTGAGLIPGAAYRTGVWTSDSTIVAFESSQSRFVNVNYNGVTGQSTITSSSLAIGATSNWGQVTKVGGSNRVVMATGAAGGFTYYQPDTNTFSGGTVGGNTLSAATAHNGFFIGSNQGASGRIDYYDKFNNLTRQFGSGTVLVPVSMQTVLAPEPGEWMVMGVGLVALLGRRRRR